MRTDVAVVGSGPGGLITATLLAESGRDVCLLEEGPRLDQRSAAPFSRAEMTTKYRGGGLTVALGAKVAYVEGRCVGGGSEINSGLYHRAPPAVLDQWTRTYEVAGLDGLEPHYEANEHDLHVGPLEGEAPPASRKLAEGAAALGWEAAETPRWFKGGQRQSMTETFLPRFEAALGRLSPDNRVTRLKRKGDRWHVNDVVAKTVYVAGGAIQTPALLRRSGVELNVGRSLALHATVKVVARFPEPINEPGMGVGVHQAKEGAFRFGCSVSEKPYLALALLDHPETLCRLDGIADRCAIYYAMIGGGRGSVSTLPGFRDPLVRYRLTQGDYHDLDGGLRALCRLLLAAGAEEIYPVAAGAPAIGSEADLAGLPPAQRCGLMTVHLMGSCPMGENWERCAVNSYGRVFGREDLYVADASILCTALGVNPQGTIMALARRNALAPIL